jgi:hypothetical protein
MDGPGRDQEAAPAPDVDPPAGQGTPAITERRTFGLVEVGMAPLGRQDREGLRDHVASARGELAERTRPVLIHNQQARLPAVDAEVPQAAVQCRKDPVRVIGGVPGPLPARVLTAVSVTRLVWPVRPSAPGQARVINGEEVGTEAFL